MKQVTRREFLDATLRSTVAAGIGLAGLQA
jgi:hypothetical protein